MIMSTFNQSIGKLNHNQFRAVSQTEGPVLVLAGPGTGKTEVLAVRIGHILKERDVNPNNILCLTYSNAGVKAMRKRLKELIGETADKVEISTFHAFSNKIIGRVNPGEFQAKKLITDAQRSMLIEKIIFDHLSAEDPANIKPASGKKIGNMIKIFATLKQEGLTREEIQQYARHCIDDILPYEQQYLKQNNELNAKGKELKERILHFADNISVMFEEYCNELEKRNKIEYEDMLVEAIALLTSDSDLLNSLRENYLYILVDEFQDTNKKQLALLDLLVSGNMEPNLFVVGDDDQCIYRFQGASSLNFDWMRNKFNQNLEIIELNINYRSTSVLLRESFNLISHNNNRQQNNQQALVAGNSQYKTLEPVLPTFKSFENAEQEACSIARSVAQQLNSGKPAETIAILARRHADFEPLKKWLLLYNIAWQSNIQGGNLLDGYFGKSIFYLIQFVKNQDRGGYNAAGFFTQFMLLKPNANELIKAFIKSRNEKDYNLFEWLKNNSNEIGYFNKMSNVIDELIESKNNTLNNEIIELLAEAVYAGVDILLSEEEKKAWSDFIQTFIETDRYKNLISLADYLWYHDQNKISITIESNEQTPEENAVIFSTIHGSKGLEYDIVYLVACHNKNWEDKDHRGSIKVPDLLNRFISPEADSLEDMRKLIYVACTRAKTELHVSYHRKSSSDKDTSNTVLLNSFGTGNGVELEVFEDFIVSDIVNDTYTIQVDEELMHLIREKIENFEISPTSTGVWQKCQNEFLFTQVLKIGGIFSEAPSFGTVIHNVLQRYATNENRDSIPNFIFNLINEEMNRQKHLFHSTHFEKYKLYAKWLVPNYLRNNPIHQTPSHIENEFHAVLSNGVKIKGKLDRVEVNGDEVKVIDYKTGRYKDQLKPFVDSANPGTQYWRQAMMYSMLMRENFKEKGSMKFEFHYPEIENGIFSFSRSDHEGFKDWLEQIWQRTKRLEFNIACDDPRCIYCAAKLI